MKLYELSEQYESALNELSNMEDLTPEVVTDSLAALKGDLEEKGRAVAAFTLNVDADIKTLKDHEDAIAAKRKTLEKRRDWMRDYLRENMEKCGITKIESPYFNITLTKPRKAVVIDDETALPRDYMRVVESPDKSLIKRAMDDGYEVPGAHMGEGKPGLRIK